MLKSVRSEIAEAIARQADLPAEEAEEYLEIPPEPQMGDYAFPCFVLSPRLREAPPRIAARLAVKLSKESFLEEVQNRGPYVNFFVDWRQTARNIVEGVKSRGKDYGCFDDNRDKMAVVDYSAPNIAKPFGVGHLRSTVIGGALINILRASGYQVVGINYLGDWGTQFGKLMVAFKEWGDTGGLTREPVKYLYDLYVRFHREAEHDPELEDRARDWFRMLEERESEAVRLWEQFRRLSLEDFQGVYRRLGIEFDVYEGESFYNQRVERLLRLIEDKGLLQESEGALVVRLDDYQLPPILLQKKDGTTLYATRDLAAAVYRYEEQAFDQMLYVVGAEQSLHFQQLFQLLELLGFPWAQSCVHVAFGLIHFEEGRMSTREGKTIFLEELLDRAVGMAEQIIAEKNPQLENRREAARKVGIGAVIFGDLVNDRLKDVAFHWDRVLDFTGETAPYVQYSHARICSILRRFGALPSLSEFDASLLERDEERQLVIALGRFSENIDKAAKIYKPSLVARYLIDLARSFNRFYHSCPVVQAQEGLRQTRILLIDAVRQVLFNGLSLLNIEAPEEM